MKKIFAFILCSALICLSLFSCGDNADLSETESDTSVQASESDISEETSKTVIKIPHQHYPTPYPRNQNENGGVSEVSEPITEVIIPDLGGTVGEAVYRNRVLTDEEFDALKYVMGSWRISEYEGVFFDEREIRDYNNENYMAVLAGGDFRGNGQDAEQGRITRVYSTGEYEITVNVFYPESVFRDRFPTPEENLLLIIDLSRLVEENIITVSVDGNKTEYTKR